MYYIYLLTSLSHQNRRYIGFTDDLQQRLEKHNAGYSLYTKPYKPWKIVAFVCVETKEQAIKLEKYLKTGSGTTFANRHLWPIKENA